jgi:uncharacterized protein YbaR (Trm112 family)
VFLLLTDKLTCPRCGPGFGLVLLASELQDRVVRQGRLGCANCRDAYPIEDGFADLRAAPRGPLERGLAGTPPPEGDDESEATRLRALLGIVGGPGTLALVGEPARHARALARMLPEMHVVAVDADLRAWPEESGVSRLVSAPGIPLVDMATRGLVLDGRLGEGLVGEAARVVAPRGRVAVLRPAPDAANLLERAGCKVLASDPETVVAARS